MDAPTAAVALALFLSLGGNAFLAFKLRTRKAESKYTYDAQALLRDLLQGQALLRIERIAPEQVFLRSPRDL